MPYDCVIQHKPDYLRVDVSGNWTKGKELEDALDVWLQVVAACRKTGLTRILSVWNVPGKLPTMAGYDLTNDPLSRGWDHQYRLAVVHLHEERFQDALFAETVAVNRGFQIKIFRDEQSAMGWLMESERQEL